MGSDAAALGFTVLLWWLSTGLLILLCLQPRRLHGVSFAAATVLLPVALAGIAATAPDASPRGAYLAFLSAIGVWAWLEMGFLMGFITGPRPEPCPPGARGLRRFGLAVQALLYHELSIAAAAALILALTWRAPNQTGCLAFLILMIMRISAKLNIFLGVPHLSDGFLPAPLAHLRSYFRIRRFNPLFPVSVAGGLAGAIWLAHREFAGQGPAPAGCALLLALLALGILEHVFMMTALPDSALWQWAVPAPDSSDGGASRGASPRGISSRGREAGRKLRFAPPATSLAPSLALVPQPQYARRAAVAGQADGAE